MNKSELLEEQSAEKTLLQLFKSPIAFHAPLAEVAGGALAGLFLSQLFYWADKGRLEGGWIYKDWKEWKKETCMTEDEQRGARKKLKERGLIEISDLRKLGVDKFNPTLAFRINFKALQNALKANILRGGNIPLRDGDIPLPCGDNPPPEGNSPLLSTEITAKITAEITPPLAPKAKVAQAKTANAKAGEEGTDEGFENQNQNQDPTPQDVVDATRWAMRSSTHPMGAGLEHTIRMRWAAGKAGGEYREIDLDTVARWRKAQLEAERKVQAAEAIARHNSKEGTGIENLVGRRFLVSTSGAIVVGKHYGITIGTKLTPTPQVLQMIADGLLVELHDEEVAA